MKKTFTTLALLAGLTVFSQTTTTSLITTQTLVSLQTFTNTETSSGNILQSNPPTYPIGILLEQGGNFFGVVSFTLSSTNNFNYTGFDSLKVDVKAINRSNNNTTSITINSTNIPLNNVVKHITYTTTAIAGQISYSVSGSNYSAGFYLDSLKITTYKTTTITTPPTNTTTTGIKNNTGAAFNLFVARNVIKSNVENENFKLKVFDITGKKVFETVLRNEIRSDLNEGIYILNVFDGENNLIETKRVFITQ